MTTILGQQQSTERTVSNDLSFGLSNEDIMINNLRVFFPNYTNITNTKEKYNNKYCLWDYECDDGNRFELKSRRLISNAYSSALLSCHKADKNCSKKQYFIFNYLDKVLYIEYNEKLFNTFGIKTFRDYRFGRNGKEEKCFEIPIYQMRELNTKTIN
tara:strand:- start:266 stop:736 length:471 start_codon:yes stop_codon:yes gene_type:complete